MTVEEPTTKQHFLVGVVSWADGCAKVRKILDDREIGRITWDQVIASRLLVLPPPPPLKKIEHAFLVKITHIKINGLLLQPGKYGVNTDVGYFKTWMDAVFADNGGISLAP